MTLFLIRDFFTTWGFTRTQQLRWRWIVGAWKVKQCYCTIIAIIIN